MSETEKIVKRVDNSSYRERFQFQLLVNDNIICQRYFKIPRFNSDSLVSAELYNTLSDACNPMESLLPMDKQSVVGLIKRDLESKSRIYLANTLELETKLTGFVTKKKALEEAKAAGADSNELSGIILRSESDDTYVTNAKKEWDETEYVNPWDVTFKFMFMVDDRVVFSEIWDGSQYPKYVRNSVDITNAKSPYPMVQLMNSGKDDLAVMIINRICAVCSNTDNESERQYTKSFHYGDKKYSYSVYNREYVNSWRAYCAQKYGRIQ